MLNSQILKNTVFLFIRQFANILFGLFTVRYLLLNLGITNYGLYNVLVSFVLLISFVRESLITTYQRFLSVAVGEGRKDQLGIIFNQSIIVFFIASLISTLIILFVGEFFVIQNIRTIGNTVGEVKLVFRLLLVAFFIGNLTSPYTAILFAYEDIKLVSKFAILETFLKFVAAYGLVVLSNNKLIQYAVVLILISIIMTATTIITCRVKYEELGRHIKYNPLHGEKMNFFSFAGWTFFGQITTTLRNQATTILVNQFYNPFTVAALVISKNIANQLQQFSINLGISINTPIIKLYSSGEFNDFKKLIYNSCKIAFLLMWTISTPLAFNIQPILKLWLSEVPKNTDVMICFFILEMLFAALTLPLQSAARAYGNMRFYEVSLGTVQIFFFVVSWILATTGYSVLWILSSGILMSFSMSTLRFFLLKKMFNISVADVFTQIARPIIIFVTISIVSLMVIDFCLHSKTNAIMSLLKVVSGLILNCILGLRLLTSKEQRKGLVNTILKRNVN